MDHLISIVAVVDDDVSVRKSVERLLSASGFVTETYSSAEDFLRGAQTSKISCLVLDVNLGRMSGIGLWHHLKDHGVNLPVIFITAVENDTLKREAINAGCVGYLQKPFAGEALVTAINTALVRRDPD